MPPVSFPEARARVALKFGHSELGQFTFDGRKSGIHNGGLRPREKVNLSLRDGQWRETMKVEASVTPVGNTGKR